jgi:polysaccharide export outer membrane protein
MASRLNFLRGQGPEVGGREKPADQTGARDLPRPLTSGPRPLASGLWPLALAACLLALASAGLAAQEPAKAPAASSFTDYVVGPQDVLTITSYDQADLSGKFAIEADGTFTYPMIGRVKAGGLTLRALEGAIKKQLKDDGYFKNPQITVSVDTYKSQRVFIVGEVRTPGAYPLSGNTNLVEALARAGSTLPTASGEVVIVHAGENADGPTLPTQTDDKDIVRVNLRELENGAFSQNARLQDGDTIFVPRAQSVYVFGQVKNPGAYSLQQSNTTVLQALSLAGGVTDRGSTSRLKIIRIVSGEKRELKAKLTDLVQPGDTIVVSERFF